MANRASFIRIPADGGQPTLVHAAQSVPSTGTGQDEIVSGFAIRAGFNALEDQISDSWPPVGGFAVEHLGNGVINFGGQSSWSNATEAPVFGVGGIRYSLSNGFRATGGPFTFPAASTVEVDVYCLLYTSPSPRDS